MVRRPSGKEIIHALLVCVLVALGLWIYSWSIKLEGRHRYLANDDYLSRAVLNGIVEAEKSEPSGTHVKAVVVPHHLVASKSVALGIKALASSTPSTAVIISPDHFGNCPKLLCTTKGGYKTFFGDISIADKEVDQLTKSKLVGISELFTEEHGIYSIVPFIKYYIPKAQIIPIVISQKSKGTEANRLEIIELLKPMLSRGAALVISSDFSHYLPLDEANEMDKKTQNSFCSGDSKVILNFKNPSQSDCPLCLWILEQEAMGLGFWNPVLVSHTNSAELLNNTEAKETTSHFTFLFSSTDSNKNECF